MLEVARAGTTLIVAEHGDELVGVVRVRVVRDRAASGVATLGLLAVEPGRQGRGVGARLVAAAERTAAAAGCAQIDLACGRELGMDDFYSALGYGTIATDWGARWGSTLPFTLVTMRKELRGRPARPRAVGSGDHEPLGGGLV